MNLKERKVKSIKLNPEKGVRYINDKGRSAVAIEVGNYSLGSDYWYRSTDFTSGAIIMKNYNLTDYGVQEYEAGNIIVEFEDEEDLPKVFNGFQQYGKEVDDIKATSVNDLIQQGRLRFNSKPRQFKTELPSHVMPDEIGAIWSEPMMLAINQLIDHAKEQDERIVELERQNLKIEDWIKNYEELEFVKKTDYEHLVGQIKELEANQSTPYKDFVLKNFGGIDINKERDSKAEDLSDFYKGIENGNKYL